jgi:hypothetical protein
VWDWEVGSFLNDGRQVNGCWPLVEVIAAVEVDLLPSDRRDLLKHGSAWLI